MNYYKVYLDLCNSRMALKKERTIDRISNKDYELHHIQMKRLGGSDQETNLVLFTIKEHIIAHHLLYKYSLTDSTISTNDKIKYGFAFNSMAGIESLDNKRSSIPVRLIVEAEKLEKNHLNHIGITPIIEKNILNPKRKDLNLQKSV